MALRLRKRQQSPSGRRAGKQMAEIPISAQSIPFEIGPHWAGATVSQVEVKAHQCLMQAKLALTFFFCSFFFPFGLGRFDCAALSGRERAETAGRAGEDAAGFSKPALSKCLTKSVAARLDLLHASVQDEAGGGRGRGLYGRPPTHPFNVPHEL